MSTKTLTTLIGLAFMITACGGGGNGGGISPPPSSGTAPTIANISLSQDWAYHMAGNGTVTITGQVGYNDPDMDISTLRVEVSDGTSLSVSVPTPQPSASGTLSGEIVLSTAQRGDYTVEVWAMDTDGHASNHLSTGFSIFIDTTTWIERLSTFDSLPLGSAEAIPLTDVVWNGGLFVAVGFRGAILSSPDAIAWTRQDSGTSDYLSTVFWDGTYFYAAGGFTIIRSHDGVDWNVVNSGANGVAHAIASSGHLLVAGGVNTEYDAFLLTSVDGETWIENNTIPQTGRYITGIAWSGQQFVASTVVNQHPNNGRIMTSVDGITWVEIAVSNDYDHTYSVIWDGTQFVAAGEMGRLYFSPDGTNWAEVATGTTTHYLDVASSDRVLIAHGRTQNNTVGNAFAVASFDGGQIWQTFMVYDEDNDDRCPIPTSGPLVGHCYYTSSGLAYGNDRFVSVGRFLDSAAIFTTR